MTLCRQHLDAACALLAAKQPNRAWIEAGFAVECCLKAAIMSKERLNRWPSPGGEPELWTHDLVALAKRLGITAAALDPRDTASPSWKLVFEWERGHGYAIDKLPLKYAEQMYEAAFGPNGVVRWLASRFRLNI